MGAQTDFLWQLMIDSRGGGVKAEIKEIANRSVMCVYGHGSVRTEACADQCHEVMSWLGLVLAVISDCGCCCMCVPARRPSIHVLCF